MRTEREKMLAGELLRSARGERVFFNFNCVVLDVCRVRLGSFTLFGPAVQIYTATHPMKRPFDTSCQESEDTRSIDSA